MLVKQQCHHVLSGRARHAEAEVHLGQQPTHIPEHHPRWSRGLMGAWLLQRLWEDWGGLARLKGKALTTSSQGKYWSQGQTIPGRTWVLPCLPNHSPKTYLPLGGLLFSRSRGPPVPLNFPEITSTFYSTKTKSTLLQLILPCPWSKWPRRHNSRTATRNHVGSSAPARPALWHKTVSHYVTTLLFMGA